MTLSRCSTRLWMSVLRRHPLVRADLSEAINWYEDQQPGLGLEFAADFLSHYRHLARDAQLYAIRFADVRRLNLDRFPSGLFYCIRANIKTTPASEKGVNQQAQRCR